MSKLTISIMKIRKRPITLIFALDRFDNYISVGQYYSRSVSRLLQDGLPGFTSYPCLVGAMRSSWRPIYNSCIEPYYYVYHHDHRRSRGKPDNLLLIMGIGSNQAGEGDDDGGPDFVTSWLWSLHLNGYNSSLLLYLDANYCTPAVLSCYLARSYCFDCLAICVLLLLPDNVVGLLALQ